VGTTSPRRLRRRPTPRGARSSESEENQISIFPTKILLAADGTSEAQLAVRTAVELTQKTDSELHTIHIVAVASSIALLYPEATDPKRVERQIDADVLNAGYPRCQHIQPNGRYSI
jgi:hypothetical protein